MIDDSYDHVITEPYFYLWPLILQLMGPDIFHINVGWGIQALHFFPFIHDKSRTVVDFYEVLGFLDDSYFNKMHSTSRQVKCAERYLCENYYNIIHLCSDKTTDRLKAKYKVNSNIVSIVEYLTEPTYFTPPRKSGIIRLVYGGNMLISDSPDDPLYHAFMAVVNYFNRENLRLYIFNSPYIHGMDLKNGLDVLIEKENLHNIFSCRSLGINDFARQISEFDYGITFLRPKDMGAADYNYFMATKFLTYLRAGLPVVIDSDNAYMAGLVKKYGLGVVLEDDDYRNLPEILNQQDLETFKANVLRFRSMFHIEIGAAKLMSIYNSIMDSSTPGVLKSNCQAPGFHSVDASLRPVPRYLTQLIESIAKFENRLYYRDQTAESLSALVDLVQSHKPSRIVELGTLSGMSLRTWIYADPKARVTAIDLSFDSLRRTLSFLPFDTSSVTLVEQDIVTVDFSRLWSDEDRVLLYVDAHDEPGVPIMDYLIKEAFPRLPSGSLIIVDDLWFSPARLTPHNMDHFFRSHVIHQIDPLQCFTGYYAPYWEGGSFMGFAEVAPLLRWVNMHRIKLHFNQRGKNIAIEVHHPKGIFSDELS